MEKVIDGTARAERDWVEDHAAERGELFAETRRARAQELVARRRGMSLLERHRWTAEQQARLSTVGAASVGLSSRSVDGPSGPPFQATVDFEHADRLIRMGIELREQVLDELAGLGPARDFAAMPSLEKDRLLIGDLAPMSPAEVEVHFFGALGSAETVRRRRSKIRRDAQGLEKLRADGWGTREIRERLGLSADDELLAREWLTANS